MVLFLFFFGFFLFLLHLRICFFLLLRIFLFFCFFFFLRLFHPSFFFFLLLVFSLLAVLILLRVSCSRRSCVWHKMRQMLFVCLLGAVAVIPISPPLRLMQTFPFGFPMSLFLKIWLNVDLRHGQSSFYYCSKMNMVLAFLCVSFDQIVKNNLKLVMFRFALMLQLLPSSMHPSLVPNFPFFTVSFWHKFIPFFPRFPAH